MNSLSFSPTLSKSTKPTRAEKRSAAELLFFQVWRNIYIRKQITHQLYSSVINGKHTISSLDTLVHKLKHSKEKYKEEVANLLKTLILCDDPLERNKPSKQAPSDLVPESITTLYLKIRCPLALPIGLKNILFSKHSSPYVDLNSIPSGIESIRFSKTSSFLSGVELFEKPFLSLTRLTICSKSQEILKFEYHRFYQNLSTLIINKPLNNTESVIIPSSVRNLIFGTNYHQTLPVIPSNVLYLQVGRSFNKIQFLDELPITIESLILYTPKLCYDMVKDFEKFKNLKKLLFFITPPTADIFDTTSTHTKPISKSKDGEYKDGLSNFFEINTENKRKKIEGIARLFFPNLKLVSINSVYQLDINNTIILNFTGPININNNNIKKINKKSNNNNNNNNNNNKKHSLEDNNTNNNDNNNNKNNNNNNHKKQKQ